MELNKIRALLGLLREELRKTEEVQERVLLDRLIPYLEKYLTVLDYGNGRFNAKTCQALEAHLREFDQYLLQFISLL